jgi:hypothetical protein
MEHFANPTSTPTNNEKSVLNFYLFYSNNCPHSQKFLNDQWNILRKKYANKVIFNKFNCDEEKSAGICKLFDIKSVPTICLMYESYTKSQNQKFVFEGVRSLENLEKFLNNHIELNTNTNTEFFKESKSNSKSEIEMEVKKTKMQPTMNDLVEFEKIEDIKNKNYKYCIKYNDEDKKEFNHCQSIDEKETPNLKSWQGSYTVVSDYLKKVTRKGDLQDKKTIAFKYRDQLADWHLCDPILLQTIKTNIESLPDNKDDMNINAAIEYGCGFNKNK